MDLIEKYNKTPKILKLIDFHTLFCFILALLNILYKMSVNNLQFNSFINTTYFCFSSSILALCFRIKITNQKENESNGKLIWEFFFSNIVLLIANFWAYQY